MKKKKGRRWKKKIVSPSPCDQPRGKRTNGGKKVGRRRSDLRTTRKSSKMGQKEEVKRSKGNRFCVKIYRDISYYIVGYIL